MQSCLQLHNARYVSTTGQKALPVWAYSLSRAVSNRQSSEIKQDAQLSQRDRAAGCVIVFVKSRRLELEDNILQTL